MFSNQSFRVGIRANGNRKVDVTSKPGLGPRRHSKCSKQRRPFTLLIEPREYLLERFKKKHQRESAGALRTPSASPNGAPGRVRNHAARRLAISSSPAARCSRRNCARFIATPLS
jgi:hypothetical protein